jgi:hypothetical protein
MGLGNSSRDIHVAIDRNKAFQAVVRAGQSCGSVTDQSAAMGTVTVKTRYGLQAIKLRVSVIPNGDGAVISISGFGDDVWGGGARKGTDKFLAALEANLR